MEKVTNCLPIESKKKHRTEALKRYLIFDGPNYLIINLKRFSQTGYYLSKNSKRISFGEFLDLDDFMIHAVPKENDELLERYLKAKEDGWEARFRYRLYGIVCHSGGMGGGHYIAYMCYTIKDKRRWYYASDSHVSEVPLKDAL